MHTVTDCFELQSTFVNYEKTYKHKHMKCIMRPTNKLSRYMSGWKSTINAQSNHQVTIFPFYDLYMCQISWNRHYFLSCISRIRAGKHQTFIHECGTEKLPCEHGLKHWRGATHLCAEFLLDLCTRQHRSSTQGIAWARQGAVAVVVKFPSLVPNCTGITSEIVRDICRYGCWIICAYDSVG